MKLHWIRVGGGFTYNTCRIPAEILHDWRCGTDIGCSPKELMVRSRLAAV